MSELSAYIRGRHVGIICCLLESFTFAFTLTGLCITSYGVTICCWDVHGKVYVQAGFRCMRRHDYFHTWGMMGHGCGEN